MTFIDSPSAEGMRYQRVKAEQQAHGEDADAHEK
jgi:hypothetical protein